MRPETAPSGWRASTLGEVAEYINGFPFKPHQWKDHGLPIIRIAQMHDPEASCDYFPGEIPAHFKIVSGDLLFSWSATLMALIWNRGPAYVNQHIFKVIPTSGHDLAFTHHLLNYCLDGLAGQSHGTTMKHVKRSDLLPFKVFTPPLPEQRRIAEILDTLDQGIRKTEQVIAKLQQMKQGLLHDLLTRGIDENGELRDPERHPEQFKESPLGRIPREWEVVKLASLGSFMNGINKPKHAFGQGTKFVNISDVYPEQLDTSGLGRVSISAVEQERYRLIPGDVLIDRSSVKLEGVGYPTVFKKSDEAVIFCGFIIRFRPNDPEQGLFLCRQMRSRPFRLQVFKVATASANVNVNQAALGNLLLAMPTKIERVRIAEAEAIGNARIPKEQAQLAKLRSLKQGLMDDLLTGRVRVAVPEEATS